MDPTAPQVVIKSGRALPTLTKDKASLAKILWSHVDRVDGEYAIRRTLWSIAWYYLNGYRRFTGYDPANGQVKAWYLDEKGDAEFQSSEILFRINRVVGRLMAMDLSPQVLRNGTTTLGSLRDRAVAQVFADSVSPDQSRKDAQEWFSYLFATLGSAGMCGHLIDHPVVGMVGDLEVVHPREIMPFPVSVSDASKSSSLMRVRYVPMDWLKERFGDSVASKRDSLEVWEADPGDAWADGNEGSGTPSPWDHRGNASPRPGSGGGGHPPSRSEWIEVVKFRELWLRDEAGLVGRYIASSGDEILQDEDTRSSETYCPLGYARFFNNGSFYGAGMFDVMFSIGRSMEKMMKSLFRNVEDVDRFGVVVLPQGEFPDNVVLKEIGRGLRAFTWSPDPLAEGQAPFVIQPHNSGDIPGRTAQFAKENLEDVDPVRDLIEEKGRVDSAAGLSALDDQINRALSSPTWGIQKAWGAMYLSLTHRAIGLAATSDRGVPVKSLSLDMAGVVIDPSDDTVSFKTNRVPDVGRLVFSVRETTPRSMTSRKQEAVELWEKGIETDPIAFRMHALDEGLDFALYMEDDRGAMEASDKIILTLYGDGETPGEIRISARTIKPEMLMRRMTGFMVGPHMQVASEEVKAEFQRVFDQCLEWMGLVLPAAVPNPDDAAMLSQGVPGTGVPGMDPSGGGMDPSQGLEAGPGDTADADAGGNVQGPPGGDGGGAPGGAGPVRPPSLAR